MIINQSINFRLIADKTSEYNNIPFESYNKIS